MTTWGRVLLTGATSGIARAIAHRLAEDNCQLVLLARDFDEADRLRADLELRWSIQAEVRIFDATDTSSHRQIIDELMTAADLDGAILCHGFMAEQSEAAESAELAKRTVDVNYTSYMTLCSALASHFQRQRKGFICAVSSVAGDRGRQSNFIYGSAKGALNVYLQGLRNAMHVHDMHVLTVKPGFVDTGMTWGLLNPDSPLVASPEKVANDIVKAIRKRRNSIYTPWFWRWIMLIIRAIPETVFKRLKL